MVPAGCDAPSTEVSLRIHGLPQLQSRLEYEAFLTGTEQVNVPLGPLRRQGEGHALDFHEGVDYRQYEWMLVALKEPGGPLNGLVFYNLSLGDLTQSPTPAPVDLAAQGIIDLSPVDGIHFTLFQLDGEIAGSFSFLPLGGGASNWTQVYDLCGWLQRPAKMGSPFTFVGKPADFCHGMFSEYFFVRDVHVTDYDAVLLSFEPYRGTSPWSTDRPSGLIAYRASLADAIQYYPGL